MQFQGLSSTDVFSRSFMGLEISGEKLMTFNGLFRRHKNPVIVTALKKNSLESLQLQWNVNTSTPVVRTGVYSHMTLADETQIVYHTGCHRPCSGHHARSATVQQVCCTRLTTVERVIDFSIFDLGGLPLGERSPKGEMTWWTPRSITLQNFSPIAQTVYEICVTKVFSTFWPRGLTPWPKFTKRGDDLVDS